MSFDADAEGSFAGLYLIPDGVTAIAIDDESLAQLTELIGKHNVKCSCIHIGALGLVLVLRIGVEIVLASLADVQGFRVAFIIHRYKISQECLDVA